MSCQELLTSEKIKSAIREHLDQTIASVGSPACRKAAVLIPIFCMHGTWHILYTRRSDFVNDHKGQVSFPGGVMESNDRSIEETALREANEEIGIDPGDVNLLGRLDDMASVSGFMITPVVAELCWPIKFNINSKEVSRVFSIPMKWLSVPEHYENRFYAAPDGRQGYVYFYKPYDSEQLWGISARITLELLDVLGLLNDQLPSRHVPRNG